MDIQTLKEKLNVIINSYYSRQYALVGDRYFEKEYITDEILSDDQLVQDILALIDNKQEKPAKKAGA